MRAKTLPDDSIPIGTAVGLLLFFLCIFLCFIVFLRRCPNCDAPMKESQEYCAYCGKATTCECGATTSGKFCQECGAQLLS